MVGAPEKWSVPPNLVPNPLACRIGFAQVWTPQIGADAPRITSAPPASWRGITGGFDREIAGESSVRAFWAPLRRRSSPCDRRLRRRTARGLNRAQSLNWLWTW